MKVVLNSIKVNKEVEGIAGRIADLFTEAGTKVYATEKLSKTLGIPNRGLSGDLIIAIGGDGTILDTEASLSRPTPILGVHKGDVGFLTQVGSADVDVAIKRIIAKNFSIEKRSKLSIGRQEALNEVAIVTAKPAEIIHVRVEVDGRLYKEFDADGIIVATPTGSTAYALSAGGPIVDPDVRAIVLVPVCPYTLAARPIVISDKSRVRITLLEGDAKVAVDGQAVKGLKVGESVIIRRADREARFVKFDEHFYKKLSSLVR